MIIKKRELTEILREERNLYFQKKSKLRVIFEIFTKESCLQIWRFQRTLRKTEYHYNNRKRLWHKILYILYLRKKNNLGIKLGIFISVNVFDAGLKIEHYGSITVNGFARVGKNCRLHGNNCIGNKGIGRIHEIPSIGDNFDLGFGASVIGLVSLQNNVKVGVNAVVTRTFSQSDIILVGIPANIINLKGEIK